MAKRWQSNLSCFTKALLRVFYVAAIVGLMVHCVSAQDTSKPPAFDVAAINPVQKGAPVTMTGLMNIRNGIVDVEYVTVQSLIGIAYGVPLEDQVFGAPDWAKSERYNIVAKMSDADAAEYEKLSPVDQKKRRELMLQTLLAERFKLKVHPETKQVSDYEMVVAKSGLKHMTDADPDAVKDSNGQTIQGMARIRRDGTAMFQQFTMEQFASFLTHQPAEPGRLVVDKTGLTGKYTFTLNWAVGRSITPGAGGGAATPGDDVRSLFTVLQEDLGLRLQPSTGTEQTIIIDHLERPTEN